MITREPVYTTEPDSIFVSAWRSTLLAIGSIGWTTLMTLRALLVCPTMAFEVRFRKEVGRQMFVLGIKSLALITIVGLFTGMILGLQMGLELRRFNQEFYIGSGVMVALLREMGPFMTGIILAACVGSSMAAQLGTMSVNDEIAALEIMSIDPVKFLMAPRMAAMVLMTPVLSFYACILGVVGGGVVGLTQLNIPWDQYMSMAMNFARMRDLYVGLLKALIFGIIITGVSCHEGFVARQGAVGVGQATRRSVITSILLILISGYIVTRFFYDL